MASESQVFKYQPTLIVLVGTTACACGRGYLNKRQAAIQRLKQKLEKTSDPALQSSLRDQLQNLEEGMITVAIDIDGTGNYKLHQPLSGAVRDWEPGQFMQLHLPDLQLIQRDLARAYQSGQSLTEFPDLNPQVCQVMASVPHASGGNPPAGLLAAQHRQPEILDTFCQHLRFLRSRPQRLASNQRLRIILVGSSFGGTAAGAWEYITRLLLEAARAEGIQNPAFERIFMRPGSQTSSATLNSLAVTHMADREGAAIATGWSLHQVKVPGIPELQKERSRYVYPWHVSPENNAPQRQVLSREGFNTQIANLLWLRVATALGDFLESKLGDFERTAHEVTTTGEYKRGRSIGLAVIYFPRDWLLEYAKDRGQQMVLDRLLGEPESESVDLWITGFFQTHPLVQGGGNHEVSERLLKRFSMDDPHSFTLDQFRRLTSGLQGNPAEAEKLVLNARNQAGNLEQALAFRKAAFLEEVRADLYKRVQAGLLDPDQGAIFMEAALADLAQRIEHLIGLARADESFQNRLLSLERSIVLQNRQRRGRGGPDTFQTMRLREQIRIEQQGHEVAIVLLTELKVAIETLGEQIKAVVVNLNLLQQEVQAHLERVQAYRPYAECPNGYSLIRDQKDLEQYFPKILPKGGQDEAMAIVYRHLATLAHPLDGEQLQAGLAQAVNQLFQKAVESRHIGKELRDLPSQELEGMLRARDQESYEMLPLKAEYDREPEPYLLRIVLADPNCGGHEIVAALNGKANRRPVTYELVEWDDPEQIALVQVRCLFPYSAWLFEAEAAEAYRKSKKSYETLHTFASKRWLPGPGETLQEEQAQLLLVKALLLERITCDKDTNECFVRVAGCQIPLNEFEPRMTCPFSISVAENLSPSLNPYFGAVDIESAFELLYREKGSAYIEQYLRGLKNLRSDRNRALLHPVESQVDQVLTPKIEQTFQQQLAWISDNTIDRGRKYVLGGDTL